MNSGMVSSSIKWLAGIRMKLELEKLSGFHRSTSRGSDRKKDGDITKEDFSVASTEIEPQNVAAVVWIASVLCCEVAKASAVW